MLGTGRLHLEGVSVSGAASPFTSGGALHAADSAVVKLEGATLHANSAPSCGALSASGSTRMEVRRSTLSDNVAVRKHGGAACASDGSKLLLEDSALRGNHLRVSASGGQTDSTSGNGGALRVEDDASATIRRTVFNGNAVKFGYGGAISVQTTGSVELLGGALTGNAAGMAGAIRLSAGRLALRDVAVRNNRGDKSPAWASSGWGGRSGVLKGEAGTTIELRNVSFGGNVYHDVSCPGGWGSFQRPNPMPALLSKDCFGKACSYAVTFKGRLCGRSRCQVLGGRGVDNEKRCMVVVNTIISEDSEEARVMCNIESFYQSAIMRGALGELKTNFPGRQMAEPADGKTRVHRKNLRRLSKQRVRDALLVPGPAPWCWHAVSGGLSMIIDLPRYPGTAVPTRQGPCRVCTSCQLREKVQM